MGFWDRRWNAMRGFDLKISLFDKKRPDLLEDPCPLLKGNLSSGQWPVFAHDLFLHPGGIFTGSGVNGDQLALLDKGGNAKFISCLNGSRLVIYL